MSSTLRRDLLSSDSIDAEVPPTSAYFRYFDPVAPYVVRSPPPTSLADLGPWPDLVTSHVDHAGVFLGDGPDRELLDQCRISKEMWVAISAEDRLTIKHALAEFYQLQNAVRDLAAPDTPEPTRSRARTFLRKVEERVEGSYADKRSHARESARRHAVPIAHVVFEGVRRELQLAKAEYQRADQVGGNWDVEKRVRAVNLEFRRARLRQVCTAKDVELAVGRRAARGDSSPISVAAALVQRAMPVLSKDEIRRGQVRRRG